MLKLVEMDNVVNLPVREPSTFDDGWACREGAMKTRGLGREPTRKLWEKEAKRVGSAALLEALKRFLRQKPEKDGYTHPGLSVWLNQQRCDHWLPQSTNSEAQADTPKTPTAIRLVAETVFDESWIVSYLDPCTFHEDGFITPATEYAMRKLVEQKGALKAAGVAGIRRKE